MTSLIRLLTQQGLVSAETPHYASREWYNPNATQPFEHGEDYGAADASAMDSVARRLSYAFGGVGKNYSYQHYQLLGLVLSGILLISLTAMWIISKKVMFLHHTFKSIELRKGRLYFFGINLSNSLAENARKVKQACFGILRVAVVFVFLHVWQTLVILNVEFNTKITAAELSVETYCQFGWDCFGITSQFDWLKVILAFTTRPDKICDIPPSDVIDSYSGVICFALAQPSTATVSTSLAVSWALVNLFAGGFELMVWIVFDHLGTIWYWVLFAFHIIFYIVWLLLIINFQLRVGYIGTWIECVQWLCLPVGFSLVLYTADKMKRLRKEKIQRYIEMINKHHGGSQPDEDGYLDDDDEDGGLLGVMGSSPEDITEIHPNAPIGVYPPRASPRSNQLDVPHTPSGLQPMPSTPPTTASATTVAVASPTSATTEKTGGGEFVKPT
eukprot:GHVN01006133.1.p1 GENE.GHVN01006133.1~~GHVN01006133.1.p1  ORF type:complete len:443 (-),score=69.84 GHVN01006133.1:221-1549(-)